jgi:hypothetical protein
MAEIDVDRGVVSRLHRETGVRVYMYFDAPGYYYDEHSNSLSEDFAEQAGFPVKDHAKDRFKREKMKAFMSQVDRSLAEAEEAQDKEVVAEKGGYKILAMAYGTALVVDENDQRITPLPIPMIQAKGLLDALVPSDPDAMKDKAKGKK